MFTKNMPLNGCLFIAPKETPAYDELIWVTNSDPPKSSLAYYNAVIGKPKATHMLTSEELVQKGIIGIYKRPGDKSFKIVSLDYDL